MTVTADELAMARSWIGETEESAAFTARFDRLYNVVVLEGLLSDETVRRSEALARAIEESIRHQLSVMVLDQPASASAEGVSYSYAQNMITLSESLKKFMSARGGGSGSHVARLHRAIGR